MSGMDFTEYWLCVLGNRSAPPHGAPVQSRDTKEHHMHATHTSAPMPWSRALIAWLAACRAPQAGAPVLAEGVLDGATGPDDLVARGKRCAEAYLADEVARAAETGISGLHIWGASTPRDVDGAIVWGCGNSQCAIRPSGGAWVVEVGMADLIINIEAVYACSALTRADAARVAGAVWSRIRPGVRPVDRARRDLRPVA